MTQKIKNRIGFCLNLIVVRVQLAYHNHNQMHSDCEKYSNIIDWLDTNCAASYASIPALDHNVDFIFRTENDAVLFMLRWGGQKINIDGEYNLDWIGGLQ